MPINVPGIVGAGTIGRGLHFLYPVARTALVEVVRGLKTSDATGSIVHRFAHRSSRRGWNGSTRKPTAVLVDSAQRATLKATLGVAALGVALGRGLRSDLRAFRTSLRRCALRPSDTPLPTPW